MSFFNRSGKISSYRIKRAYQSLMILLPEMPSFTYSMKGFNRRVRESISKPPFNSDKYEHWCKDPWCKNSSTTPSPPPQAARLYDAVKLYAVGLNETIARGGSKTDGAAIVRNIQG